ncbi:MAG: hemolysin family protein [Alphaproteobacteria bacterium]|nr:hemolysin family protein [Alphaproteobacteria bacterium]
MLTTLVIIFCLLLLNGFFAMAELAIVSAKRVRLRQMAEEKKSKGARLALELAEDPNHFLSIVQIGVTLNSILTGAFSGAALAVPLGEQLDQLTWIAPHGEAVAFVLTVGFVSYLSLVLGELVPKRIGLSYAETIAVRVAHFMAFLAKVAAPLVWLLKGSTELCLKILGLDRPDENPVTEDEVKDMIAEGTQLGIFKPAEREMIEGVMRLADWTVRTIMTPRIDMLWLGVEDSPAEHVREICESGYSRLPVARGDMDEVLGIVHAKDLLNAALSGETLDIQAHMRPPLFVPDTTSVLRLLDMFRQSGQSLAVIIDEYGSVEGIVTAKDILEAIIGALPETGQESDEEPVQREDGSWLIDGMTPIDEVENIIGMKNLRDSGEFHTIAGFMIDKLGRIPTSGDHFHWGEARFEVVDMDGRRVDKVMILPPTHQPASDEEID